MVVFKQSIDFIIAKPLGVDTKTRLEFLLLLLRTL